MKTLADFKREIVEGMEIYCTGIEEAGIDEAWTGGNLSDAPRGNLQVIPLREKMQGIRTVTKKDTTGFYLSNNEKRGSFCGYPKAANLFYDGTVFTITERNERGEAWQRRHYAIASTITRSEDYARRQYLNQ